MCSKFSKNKDVSLRVGVLSVVLTALIWWWGAIPTFAATGVVVAPAFQFVTITASQSAVVTTVSLTNQTDAEQTFALSSLDIRQTDEFGRVALVDKPAVAATYGLSSFLRLPDTTITIAPNATVQVPIQIENPADLAPGGHYGAVVAEVITQGSSGEQVIVPAVSAVLLVHKVGGERFHLNLQRIRVTDIWWQLPKTLQLVFENQGNVHVVPHGRVSFTDLFGRVIAEGIINEGSVVVMPEMQRVIGVTIASRALALPLLPLKLTVTGQAQPGELTFAQSVYVGYIPLLGLLIIVGSGLVTGWYMRKRRV